MSRRRLGGRLRAGLLALLSDFRAIYFLSGVSLDQVRQRDGRRCRHLRIWARPFCAICRLRVVAAPERPVSPARRRRSPSLSGRAGAGRPAGAPPCAA